MTEISVEERAELQLVLTEHRGAAHCIGQAFDRLVAWAGPRGLLGEGRVGVAIYLTDMGLPENEQRSLAGFSIPNEVSCDDPSITSYRLPGGRHAVALHKGPYAKTAVLGARHMRGLLRQRSSQRIFRPLRSI